MSAALLGPAVVFCVWYGGWPYNLMLLMVFVGVVCEWGAMCRWQKLPLVLGLAYALSAFLVLMALRAFGLAATLFVLFIVWASDIGAYAAGRVIGGRRLAPSISPGKTWAGAVGGLATALAVGGLWFGFSGVVLAVSAVLSIASQLGDLGESALKRRYGVKDSGRLIPGHGGLLDRVDGLMAASIAAFLMQSGALILAAMNGRPFPL